MLLAGSAWAQAPGLAPAASGQGWSAPGPAAQPCPPALAVQTAAVAKLLDPPPRPGIPAYGALLQTSGLGWPRLDQWCVWLEPPAAGAGPNRWEQRWQGAVEAALASWAALLPIRRVQDPSSAQVRVWRRRPPLGRDGSGRSRASHGRALLSLMVVERLGGQWRLEPAVEVLVGPGQRAEALQATALHELGHAFGLWGHSDNPADAMAAKPGALPVLAPTARDRASLAWLYAQPTAFGRPVAPPLAPSQLVPARGQGEGDQKAQQLH